MSLHTTRALFSKKLSLKSTIKPSRHYRTIFSNIFGEQKNEASKLDSSRSSSPMSKSTNKKNMTTASDETLSRQQIVDLVAEEHELSNAKAQRIVKGIFDTISESVSDGKRVAISGFGTFTNVHRNARKVIHPRTGEPLTIPAQNRVKFSAFKALKDSLNDK